MDDFSSVNGSRIKVLSSYPSGHVTLKFDVQWIKKNIAVVKNIALMQWKAVAKAME